jgi:hypothetical protein
LLRSRFSVRVLVAAAFVSVAMFVIVGASAGAGSNPKAYQATLGYIAKATASCSGPLPIPGGGGCTVLEPFTVTMYVRGRDRYRIDVVNTSSAANYRYFAWLLPTGMTLRRIMDSRGGSCEIDNAMISCTRNLTAENCGCPQQDLSVEFTALGREPTRARGGYWIHYGLVTPYLDLACTQTNPCIVMPGGEPPRRPLPAVT